VLTFEQIKELMELVAERGLAGLEVDRSGFHLKIEGKAAARPAVAAAPAPASDGAPAVPTEVPPPAFAAAGGETAAAAPLPADAHVITSPIVGTFYRSPAPDAPSFVEVGDRVKKGQVLCIIEAMKLMNEIESDADGVLAEIYPQNAQPVEFGEPLFALRTS
jgi:acetyl-CoA carboxylase biotin carboxyl carrier protein